MLKFLVLTIVLLIMCIVSYFMMDYLEDDNGNSGENTPDDADDNFWDDVERGHIFGRSEED